MATFFVRRVFQLKGKRLLVLAGSVVDGAVKAGMEIRVPVAPTSTLAARIQAIEFLKHPDGEDMCLCILCPESEEAGLLAAFDVSGETLDVVESGKS